MIDHTTLITYILIVLGFIAAAFVAVGALTLVAFAVAVVQSGNNADLRDGSYSESFHESTARTAAIEPG